MARLVMSALLVVVPLAAAGLTKERIDTAVNWKIRQEATTNSQNPVDVASPDRRVWPQTHGVAQSRGCRTLGRRSTGGLGADQRVSGTVRLRTPRLVERAAERPPGGAGQRPARLRGAGMDTRHGRCCERGSLSVAAADPARPRRSSTLTWPAIGMRCGTRSCSSVSIPTSPSRWPLAPDGGRKRSSGGSSTRRCPHAPRGRRPMETPMRIQTGRSTDARRSGAWRRFYMRRGRSFASTTRVATTARSEPFRIVPTTRARSYRPS